MNFCGHCGRPLAEGQACNCAGAQAYNNAGQVPTFNNGGQFYNGGQAPAFNNAGQMPAFNSAPQQSFWESMKNKMGIGDPESNKSDAYETGKLIVPDCVYPNEGEVPVKQYKVAKMRNRFLGIPYSRAIGRMQVTNKRVIFRAPGRCPAGRTALQHEFAIDELAGVESRREYRFSFLDLFIGLFVTSFGGGIVSSIASAIYSSSLEEGSFVLAIILALIFGVAGCIPFFILRKKWLLKLMCLGGSFSTLGSVGNSISLLSDSGMASFSGGFLTFLAIMPFVLMLITVFIYAIKPNLVLIIKTKSASEAINIRRKKSTFSLFGGGKEEENTGYKEVIADDDAERCIREINAIVSDIQKLGDFGIKKWKA